MSDSDDALQWIAAQDAAMCERIADWSAINTGTFHTDGIHRLGERVEAVVASLCESAERVEFAPFLRVDADGEIAAIPLGDGWIYRQRPKAPKQVLLVVHLDTVFAKEHVFQEVTAVTREDDAAPGRRVMRGPGVSDAKGGLALLWTALEAYERYRPDDSLGWTVLLNSDEEIGSPGSAPFLAEEARRADLGLVFEPALPDGDVVGARKGSGNFTVVARGTSAHVGRVFEEGRSAVHALAALVTKIAELNESTPGVIANVGRIEGGAAANVVADFALARCNVRVDHPAQQREVERGLARWCDETGARHGVEVALHGGFNSPPKPLDAGGLAVLEALRSCGASLGIPIRWRDTGGVCDGNKLAAAGLPNVDTLGPVGGNIHSEREYLDVDSLVPRAQLVALLLLRFALGGWTLPARGVLR